jgi:hypothetical protein
VVVKVRERLAVNKQRSHRFDMERFNLKKLNEVRCKEQFHVEVSNKFAALEDLDSEMEINSAWETIRENSKNKNIRDLYRGINEFKRGYQPTNNLVKDENGDLLADSRNILTGGRTTFLSY